MSEQPSIVSTYVELLRYVAQLAAQVKNYYDDEDQEIPFHLRRCIAQLALINQKTQNNLKAVQGDDSLHKQIDDAILILDAIAERLRAVHNFLSLRRYKEAKNQSAAVPGHEVSDTQELKILNDKIIACELLLGIEKLEGLPPNLQIEPTDRCNAKCKPCPHCTTKGWIYHDISIESLDKISEVLSRSQFTEIFGLGEPSIAPSFNKLVQIAHGQGSETHIITNGKDLLTNPTFASLSKIGVSIDGDNPNTFNTIRTGLSFEAVVTATREFKARFPHIFVYIAATINRANIDEIPGIASLARDLRLDAVCYHRMATREPALKDVLLKIEDIPLYKVKIGEAKERLAGSSIRLFDYAMLDRLSHESEPLHKEKAMLVFSHFNPAPEPRLGSIEQVLEDFAQYPDRIQRFPLQMGNIDFAVTRFKAYLSEIIRRVLKSKAAFGIRQEKYSERQGIQQRDKLRAYYQVLIEKIRHTSPEELKVPYCLSPWYRFVAKADGRIFPCSCWGHSYANLNQTSSFEEEWNGEFLTGLRKSFRGERELYAKCKSCVTIDRYQGLTELLRFLLTEGIAYEKIKKHPGFDPPPGKLQL